VPARNGPDSPPPSLLLPLPVSLLYTRCAAADAHPPGVRPKMYLDTQGLGEAQAGHLPPRSPDRSRWIVDENLDAACPISTG